MSAAFSHDDRAGFTLVEIMVALTVTLAVVMAMAAATGSIARMSGRSASLVQRSASMGEVASELSSMPWASLPSGTSCQTVEGVYESCVTATDVSSRLKRFTVVVTPDDPRVPPDTIVVERGLVLSANPLNAN